KGLQVTVAGSGKEIVDASAEKGSQLLQNDRIILLTDKPAMPDIIGWSQRDVLQLADLLELKVEIMGSGYVVKQSIKKDKPIKKHDDAAVEIKVNTSDRSEEEDSSETGVSEQ